MTTQNRTPYPYYDNKRCKQTPWGHSDHVNVIADGIESHSTPSHGGLWLSNERLKKMPDIVAEANGNGRWFEEDSDWALVAVSFPECFNSDTVNNAKEAVKNWHPNVYESLYDIVLEPGESREKDRLLFEEENKDNLVAVSAVIDILDNTMVCVMATVGGERTHKSYSQARYFVVPLEDYRSTPLNKYVVDESSAQEVDRNRFEKDLSHFPK